MTRLTGYLVKLFATDATALFVVASCLLFLGQCIRIMDVSALRGQGLLVLMNQALLAMPSIMLVFMFVCVAIGLARALRVLQATRELHILHSSQRLPALTRAIALYVLVATLLVLLLAHVIAPLTMHEGNVIRSRIAADLVGRSLVPKRFAEVGDGVTITVGGRRANGEITSFFADDHRNADIRRTYIAETALLTADERGYVLQLENGTIQYLNIDGQFSEISFNRYDMVLDRLVGQSSSSERRGEVTSIELVARALAAGAWPDDLWPELAKRSVEGLRLIALCVFVAAISMFPSGRRRDPVLPIEILVLVVAFIERGISTYAPGGGVMGQAAGSFLLILVSIVLLIVRLRLYWPQPRQAHSR